MVINAQVPDTVATTGNSVASLHTGTSPRLIVQLVAVVNNADAYKLVQNLRNTVLMYDKLNVVPVTSSWNREQVVSTELAKMKMEDINAALQRLKDETIVRLALSVSKSFIPSECINEPY